MYPRRELEFADFAKRRRNAPAFAITGLFNLESTGVPTADFEIDSALGEPFNLLPSLIIVPRTVTRAYIPHETRGSYARKDKKIGIILSES